MKVWAFVTHHKVPKGLSRPRPRFLHSTSWICMQVLIGRERRRKVPNRKARRTPQTAPFLPIQPSCVRTHDTAARVSGH